MDFFEFWQKGVFLDALSVKKIKKIHTLLKIHIFSKNLKSPWIEGFLGQSKNKFQESLNSGTTLTII